MKLSLLFALIFGLLQPVQAMDQALYSDLIGKLEGSLSSISEKSTRASVNLRLADLYSDRARLTAMQEVEKNCNDCMGSKSDRLKAIDAYKKAYDDSPKEQLPRLLLQIAHLYGLTGQVDRAEKLFLNIIKDKKQRPKDLVGEAYAGLGEIQFYQSQFKKAKSNFSKSLNYPIARPGQVKHRLAWCLFNEGRAKGAVNIITNSLSKDQLTADLRKDMSRDLASFMASAGINQKSIDQLLKLSPEGQKKSNLFYLGQEADRLGSREGAVLVWNRYAQLGDVSEEDSLEILMRTAQSLFDDGALTGATATYQKFYTKFGNRKCELGSPCDDLRARSRNFVHTWIKKEKTQPSASLLAALKIYVQYNVTDVEMVQWAGHISKYQQLYADASGFYRTAADQAHAQIASAGPKKEWMIKACEASTLAEIEMAEDSEKTDLQRSAYEHYLSLNPKGSKADEIKYQLAYLDYSGKNFSRAIETFDTLVMNSRLNEGQKIKSANLVLDSLAQSKDQAGLEKKSLEYAKAFPKQRTEFLSISRKAGVNIAVAEFAGNKMDESSAKKSLSKLAAVPMDGASNKEKINIYRNQITMAEVAKDLALINLAAARILNISSASAADQEYAMDRQLWVAEAQMNFRRAYQIASKMRLANLSKDQKYLKLALLSDLAGLPSQKHYEDFIKATRSRRQANTIRAKLVRESKYPWKAIQKVQSKLISTPDIYADLLVEVFSKDFNEDQLQKHMKYRNVRNTASGHILQGILDMTDFYKFRKDIYSHKLNFKSDRQLKKTISQRLKLLSYAEARARKALNYSSFRTQISYIDLISDEYRRLYLELLKLPAPKGLKRAEVNKYKQLLKNQAEPFLEKSDYYKGQLASLWEDSKAFADMVNSADKVKGGHAKLLRFEFNSLKKWANKKDQSRTLDKALASTYNTPGRQEVKKLQSAVISNPFDMEQIERLKEMEDRRGSTSMVAFLEARLLNSQKGRL